MSKLERSFYYPTCGYFEGGKYHCGVPLFQRKDKSFFILKNGKRVNAAICNGHGTVIISNVPSRKEQQSCPK